MITLVCPRCGCREIRLPRLQAPAGYVIRGELVLLTCETCQAWLPMTRFTRVGDGPS